MPLVNITMARGRTTEAKQAMLHAIADAIHDSIGAPRDSIRVWINEVENTDFLAGTEILADKQARLAAESARGDSVTAAEHAGAPVISGEESAR